jgi:hypothetical protein
MIIGVPTMGTIPIKVAYSLNLIEKKYGDQVDIMYTQNSLVYDARHTILREAVKNGSDLLFVDSDVYFTIEAFERISSHKKPIVSGLYFQKSPERLPVAYKKVRPRTLFSPPTIEHITEIEPFMEVEGVGLGFCLIRNEVLRSFDPNKNPFEPFGGLGEDFSFFVRCRRKGYKVYLDTTLGLKHLGEYEYGQ